MARSRAGVVQWQNTSLPSWLSRVRIPSPAPSAFAGRRPAGRRMATPESQPRKVRRRAMHVRRVRELRRTIASGIRTRDELAVEIKNRGCNEREFYRDLRTRERTASACVLKIARHFFGARGKNRDFEGEI